jgi:predicted MFS family arabinose efflux permease
LRQRKFLLLFGSATVSLLGDWALVLALPFYVYEQTGSIASTGGLVVAELLPRLLLSSAAGVLVDRWDRRLTMIGSDVFRACILLAILLPLAGAPLWIVYVVAVLQASAAQLFMPAYGALLPKVLTDERDLLAANSLLSAGMALTKLIGPPLGGLLYAVSGLGVSAIVDSLSFALSAVAIMAMGPVARGTGESTTLQAPEPPKQNFLSQLGDGIRFIAADRILGVLCWTIAIIMIAVGILQTLLVPFVRTVLQFDAVELGILVAAEGLGSLLGALGLGAISRRLTSGRVLAAVLMLASLFLFGFTMARPLALSASFLFLVSVPIVVASIWVQTYYQQNVEDRVMGRVLGLTENLSALGVLVGVAAASLLGGLLELPAIMMLAVVVLFAAGVAVFLALHGVSTSASTSTTASTTSDVESLAMNSELKGAAL